MAACTCGTRFILASYVLALLMLTAGVAWASASHPELPTTVRGHDFQRVLVDKEAAADLVYGEFRTEGGALFFLLSQPDAYAPASSPVLEVRAHVSDTAFVPLERHLRSAYGNGETVALYHALRTVRCRSRADVSSCTR